MLPSSFTGVTFWEEVRLTYTFSQPPVSQLLFRMHIHLPQSKKLISDCSQKSMPKSFLFRSKHYALQAMSWI